MTAKGGKKGRDKLTAVLAFLPRKAERADEDKDHAKTTAKKKEKTRSTQVRWLPPRVPFPIAVVALPPG
jgi:hypothetical protein